MNTKLGSSSNANKNPYAKFDFKGTKECQKAYKRINKTSSNTKHLMTEKEWQMFCEKRKIIS